MQNVALALLALSALNASYVAWRVTELLGLRNPKLTHTYLGHDYPVTLPDAYLPDVLLTVEESVHFPILGLESDAQWYGMTSTSDGFVRLGPENRLFVVVMFHELHCLRVLNMGFSNSTDAGDAHLEHCLTYLRQSVLCGSDLTLEPGDFEDRDVETERVGATHVCKDWSTLYGLVEDNYGSWQKRMRGTV